MKIAYNRAMTKPQDEIIKTALRLPESLHKAIQDAAEYNGRSMNAEIVARLTDSLARPASLEALAAQQDRIESMVQQILGTLTARR